MLVVEIPVILCILKEFRPPTPAKEPSSMGGEHVSSNKNHGYRSIPVCESPSRERGGGQIAMAYNIKDLGEATPQTSREASKGHPSRPPMPPRRGSPDTPETSLTKTSLQAQLEHDKKEKRCLGGMGATHVWSDLPPCLDGVCFPT